MIFCLTTEARKERSDQTARIQTNAAMEMAGCLELGGLNEVLLVYRKIKWIRGAFAWLLLGQRAIETVERAFREYSRGKILFTAANTSFHSMHRIQRYQGRAPVLLIRVKIGWLFANLLAVPLLTSPSLAVHPACCRINGKQREICLW